MSDQKQHLSQYKGWLYKWTNYLKGYQKRWFVLQNGLLSYYRTQAEMAHTCRGTINLATAFIYTEDSCSIIISNSGTQTFHLKATSEIERQKWVTALELAKADAIKMQDPDSDEEESPDKNEIQNTLMTLSAKLEDINTCNDLIGKNGSGLQRVLSDLEQMDNSAESSSRLKVVNERATMFRIATNAMINACAEFMELAQTQGKRWQKLLQYEHEQRMKLEEMVEQLAKDQIHLETQARRSIHNVRWENPGSNSSEEEDFSDALDYLAEEMIMKIPHSSEKTKHRRNPSDTSLGNQMIPDERASSGSDWEEGDGISTEVRVYSHVSTKSDSPRREKEGVSTSKSEHRRATSQDKLRHTKSVSSETSIPSSGSTPSDLSMVPQKRRRKTIPEKPNISLNLWSVMKNAIGKELSKIPMPVNFNEPLSMLQRLAEDFEYHECLDRAATCESSTEQMAHVAAFTISAYSTTSGSRTTKPFNPLLGETYEFDRLQDQGWRYLSEQVCHHPPTCSSYTEGREWTLWQEFTTATKFRGAYLQIIPMGIAHLTFKKSGNHYTWRKVTSTVHNIIVGRLWVDNHGEMDITNHKTLDKCHLKYAAYSYFSRDTPRKVTGVVTDSKGIASWVLTGTWDNQMEGARVIKIEESNKGKPVFETGPHRIIWKRKAPPLNSEKMYHFTQLAIELNEQEDGVACTDSRLRPDLRLMEGGKWDEANKSKVQLEEKQRATRRRREAEQEAALKKGEEYIGWKPVWFTKQIDPQTGSSIHMFNNKYWECKKSGDWSACPDIYL
ncbi:hypothetical protein ScPMuIL_005738 [Solemya velum]